MEYSDFTNSKIYLNKLIESQKQHNFFSHLTNKEEDIYNTIKRLYKEDDFQTLFDPIFKTIDNSEIAVTSRIYHLSNGYGVLIDCMWLNMVRTQKYFYCLTIDSKEKDYSSTWFKNKIKELNTFDLEEKAEKLLLENNGIDLNNYIGIEDDEVENYNSSYIIDINIGGEVWGYYVEKDAEIINQEED